MKDKLGSACKILAITVLAVFFGCGILFLVDSGFNGVVGDWFEAHFIVYGEKASLSWHRLKSLLIFFFVILVLLWVLTVLVTCYLCRKRMARLSAKKSGQLIREYLSDSKDGSQLPPGYEDVVACIEEYRTQMQNNEQLIQYEAARKNDLITYLAHDLKTPLTSVVGYLSLLEEAPDMPPGQKAKYVHIALDKALRLEALINDFFDITRYNLQELALDRETIDLSYMLTQMADEFYPMLQAHGNTVTVEAGEELRVYADPMKLARVFNNILKNAIAYSYADTPIDIRAGQTEDTVWIRFINKGKTIPQRKLNTIFDKFYRLDDARSTNTGGAGLGLAIARQIITQHGGSITATSEAETTEFTVELPVKNI